MSRVPLPGAVIAILLGLTASSASHSPEAATTRTAAVAATSPVVARPLAGAVIVLDPGHNGGNAAHPDLANRIVDAGNGVRKPCNTSGTRTAAGYREHAFTLDLASRLARVLRARGATVLLTRHTDDEVGPCVNRRARIANRARADLLLSIHADGNTARSARGFHLIRSTSMTGGRPDVVASARLARTVRDAYRQRTGMPQATYTGGGDAITPRRDIGTLNLATVPAVMIETGNMRHPTDARRLSADRFRDRAASGLADGVQRFLPAAVAPTRTTSHVFPL